MLMDRFICRSLIKKTILKKEKVNLKKCITHRSRTDCLIIKIVTNVQFPEERVTDTNCVTYHFSSVLISCGRSNLFTIQRFCKAVQRPNHISLVAFLYKQK